jgi:hypothetical protein
MQPSINPSNLSPEQKDELIVQLFEQIAKLTDEISELKSRLSKNSRNSSKLHPVMAMVSLSQKVDVEKVAKAQAVKRATKAAHSNKSNIQTRLSITQ